MHLADSRVKYYLGISTKVTLNRSKMDILGCIRIVFSALNGIHPTLISCLVEAGIDLFISGIFVAKHQSNSYLDIISEAKQLISMAIRYF
jgi:hypothetical protein